MSGERDGIVVGKRSQRLFVVVIHKYDFLVVDNERLRKAVQADGVDSIARKQFIRLQRAKEKRITLKLDLVCRYAIHAFKPHAAKLYFLPAELHTSSFGASNE